MDAIISGLLGSKLGSWAGAMAVGLAIGALLKAMPGLVAKYMGRSIDKALAAGDEADDELLLAVVKWAEKKLPDAGKGSDRYALVARKVAGLFPWLQLDEAKLKDAIEKTVAKMDEELKKHQAPPAP